MKKISSLLLILAMLFCLCACGNDDSKTTAPNDTSQFATNSTEKPIDNTVVPTSGTEGATGVTQDPTDETTSSPTRAPTDEPTTAPTQAPTETPGTAPTIQASDNNISEIKELAKSIVGRWYLSGYADVYLDISYEDHQDQYGSYIFVFAENFSFKDNGISDGSGSYHINDYTIYPIQYSAKYPDGISWTPGISVFLSSWNTTMEEYNIQIVNNDIYIDTFVFVRTQGVRTQDTELGGTEVPPAATEPPVTEPPMTDIDNYRKITQDYSGRWYLAGYSDVYIDISQYDYIDTSVMRIVSHNFSLPMDGTSDLPIVKPYTIYPGKYTDPDKGAVWATSVEILFNNWNESLENNKVELGDNYIAINNNTFVRTQGIKNQESELGGSEVPPVTTEPPETEPPETEPPETEPPETEPPETEPPETEPPVTEPPVSSGDRIITGSESISNTTITGDVYITSTGVATFSNVTVNGNVYCYGKLIVSGGSANNLYAYYWDLGGITSSCDAWDGTHGLVKGAFRTCGSVIIEDFALDYAFGKWGKQ